MVLILNLVYRNCLFLKLSEKMKSFNKWKKKGKQKKKKICETVESLKWVTKKCRKKHNQITPTKWCTEVVVILT